MKQLMHQNAFKIAALNQHLRVEQDEAAANEGGSQVRPEGWADTNLDRTAGKLRDPRGGPGQAN